MDPAMCKRNALLAQKIIKGLTSRNMTGYYAKDREEALAIALSLIPSGARVTMGGALSAAQIGLTDALKETDCVLIHRDDAHTADVFISGSNAMTQDGILVNIDGNANRVSAIAYGPKKVLFIVGMNKVCCDVDAAMKRARNVAAPANAQRFGLSTPCSATGSCMDCKSPDTICCQFLIIRYSRHKDRIHVILVNDDCLGF